MFFAKVVAEKHSRQHLDAGMQKVGEKNCHFKACFLINYQLFKFGPCLLNCSSN